MVRQHIWLASLPDFSWQKMFIYFFQGLYQLPDLTPVVFSLKLILFFTFIHDPMLHLHYFFWSAMSRAKDSTSRFFMRVGTLTLFPICKCSYVYFRSERERNKERHTGQFWRMSIKYILGITELIRTVTASNAEHYIFTFSKDRRQESWNKINETSEIKILFQINFPFTDFLFKKNFSS